MIKEHLRSTYHLLRSFLARHKLKKNRKLKNIYEGRRCFLLCTGASIKNLDLTILKEEIVFGCNLLFTHPDANKIPFACYFELDPESSMLRSDDKYWREGQYHRELAEFANKNCERMILSIGIMKFCERVKAQFKNPFYLQSGGRLITSKKVRGNLSGIFNMMDGVIFAMIGTAIYMGCREIYLLGCGYTYSPIQSGHFYDDFVKTDFGKIDSRHDKVKKFAESKGVKIYNVIPYGFTSPLYQSISFEQLNAVVDFSHKIIDSRDLDN